MSANDSPATKTRILILGGGFGGVYTARHLEKQFRGRSDVEIVLVSRDNFLLMTPLLFEVCSGTLDIRHCCVPTRAFLGTTRFIEATVDHVDLEAKRVDVTWADVPHELPYDQLVLALGARTNQQMIPGSEHALTFKTLADAVVLRNHVIERFERADVEIDPLRKRRELTFVVIGAGLVGVELFGELTAFVDEIVRLYPRVPRDEVRFVLLQGGPRIMPEIDPQLASYGYEVLAHRRGAEIRTGATVKSIELNKVHLKDESIEAATIVLAAGIVPSSVVAKLPVEKDQRGHILVEPTMRCKSHPDVWALGDCAHIPGPDGTPYPNLAQHAIRAAKVLAHNIHAVLTGGEPKPFIYDTKGMMGSLGHAKAFGQLVKLRVRGFPAWWVRRSYYLFTMPGWSRRLRIITDWLWALLFRPDIVKLDIDREIIMRLRAGAAGADLLLPERSRDDHEDHIVKVE